MAEKKLAPDVLGQGPVRHWHTVGLDIPCPVARLQGRTPLLQAMSLYPADGRITKNGRWSRGARSGLKEFSCQDRERDSGCIPRSDMAHSDAAGVNGSNRILFHGAPPMRMMPNGCLGSPVIVLLLVLTEASSWMSDRISLRI